MAAPRTLVVGLAVLAAAAVPAVAEAKERLVGVQVCGADRCVTLSHRALYEARAILQRPPFRRAVGSVPFYDVLFVWRQSDGRIAAYAPLRWAPKAGATRTYGARGAVWSRTSVALTAALSAATVELRPRPASALEGPVEAVGSAAAAARRKLSPPATPLRAAASERDGGGDAGWIAALAALAVALVAATAVARRGRSASPPPSFTARRRCRSVRRRGCRARGRR